MPESVTDRPTKSHSTVFLLSKQPRYFYDADAIREPVARQWNPEPPQALADRDPARAHVPGNTPVRTTTNGVGNPEAGANARSVWNIPTQPTPFAHFATWPEALVRRMILAGTSERGCCPECGAPWVRVLDEKPPTPAEAFSPNQPSAVMRNLGKTSRLTVPGAREALVPPPPRTVGWAPSCACTYQVVGGPEPPREYPPLPVPCTVLDPFAGSATTMLVARNHGRHSIGIELNEDYLQISAKRLQQLSLLQDGAV